MNNTCRVERLSLECVEGASHLVAASNYESQFLPVSLSDIDLWQFEQIENDAEFYLVDNGPSCWEMLCGRIWVILVNKDTAYSRLLVMN